MSDETPILTNPEPEPEPEPYVIVQDQKGADRLALSPRTKNCIHRKALNPAATAAGRVAGPLCAACEWETPRYRGGAQ